MHCGANECLECVIVVFPGFIQFQYAAKPCVSPSANTLILAYRAVSITAA